ncbi:HAD hydrolase-like protein [Dactylosporangium maewongense]|uniref:HAD hydrolase-like protein n=1 Tax=Dactylosporangium maewongense TaxID=634393 RepID=A0ABN2CVZ5_9ACTN
MEHRDAGLVIWDVDGTLIPADLRWLRRSIARTYEIDEAAVTFPETKVHGYTDESIVIDTAIASGIASVDAEAGVPRFHQVLAEVMEAGRDELARVQPPYPGVAASIAELHRRGFVQTVLTGNLRVAAEIKIQSLGLGGELDLEIGGYGSDERDRFRLPDVVARRYQSKYGAVVLPDRTVVVGDAPNDIACARSAGFRAVVVAHRASLEELSSYGPDAVLDSLEPDLFVATIAYLVQQR